MTDATSPWFHPRGSLAADGWSVVVEPGRPGWRHTGLRVGELDGSLALTLPRDDRERQVIPLAGSFRVRVGETELVLDGRPSVFAGPTDTVYLPPRTSATVSGHGRVAVAEAVAGPAASTRTPHRLPADATPVELRGRGPASRQVHDLGTPAVLDADRLIACEVITPAGNWSSYPAHKHDEHRPGHESRLEEIYYFELRAAGPARDAASGAEPFALFSVSSSPATTIELEQRVHDGDVVLVPGGFHGPAAAPPGYDLYYLNVMAGPDERVWEITDDPAQAWVRQNWPHEPVDERLPFDASTRKGAEG